jgi:hypothetical protein
MHKSFNEYPFEALFDYLDRKPRLHKLEGRFVTSELSKPLEALLCNHITMYRKRHNRAEFELMYPNVVELVERLLKIMEQRELIYVSTDMVTLCAVIGDINHAIDDLKGSATFKVVNGKLTLNLNTTHTF